MSAEHAAGRGESGALFRLPRLLHAPLLGAGSLRALRLPRTVRCSAPILRGCQQLLGQRVVVHPQRPHRLAAALRTPGLGGGLRNSGVSDGGHAPECAHRARVARGAGWRREWHHGFSRKRLLVFEETGARQPSREVPAVRKIERSPSVGRGPAEDARAARGGPAPHAPCGSASARLSRPVKAAHVAPRAFSSRVGRLVVPFLTATRDEPLAVRTEPHVEPPAREPPRAALRRLGAQALRPLPCRHSRTRSRSGSEQPAHRVEQAVRKPAGAVTGTHARGRWPHGLATASPQGRAVAVLTGLR
eukprot:scaffold3844_cov234-Prasinococcus_capsulatus_cf.AAC.2